MSLAKLEFVHQDNKEEKMNLKEKLMEDYPQFSKYQIIEDAERKVDADENNRGENSQN